MRSRRSREIGLQVLRIVCRCHTVDAGGTILAGEPVGFLHPFQIDDVVQRGQCHPSFRSCQFSYPLPFRGQVRKAQSPLPCFPSTVLSSRRPPSLDRVPVSPVPRRHRYYEGATTSRPRIPGHLFVSLPGPTRFLLGSCSLMPALPGGWRSRLGPGSLFSRRSHCRRALAWTRVGLSGSQATHPVPLPRSTTPAEPTFPRQWRSRRCCPCCSEDKGFSVLSISGLPRGFSTCCLRFTSDVAITHARTRFRLAGSPLPGGS